MTPLGKPEKKARAHAYLTALSMALFFFFAHGQMGWTRLTGKFSKVGHEADVTHNPGK